MCASLLECPVCCQQHFASLEALRINLIKVAIGNLICPICKEVVIGLDKLTIHLFSHRDAVPQTNKVDEKTTKSVKPERLKNKSGDSTKQDDRVTKYQKTSPSHSPSSAQGESSSVNVLPFAGIPKNISEEISSKSNDGGQPSSMEKCEMCGFYFLGKNILQIHQKLMHNFEESPNTNGKYPCHLCSKVFKMRGSLMVHTRVVHFGMPSMQFTIKEEQKDKQPELPVRITYPKIEEVKNADNKPTKDTKIVPADVDTNGNITNTKQWRCDICQKLFTTKYFLKKHKRLHTGEMPYSCAQCNKTFTFQQSYHKHLLYHNDDKPHTCTHCGRSFKELSTLHNHQRIHTGEKPFSCESCGKCFRQRVSYLVHRRIHTGVMPYKCTACQKNFRYKVSQRTHKCTMQPPGTVVRQSGELVQKLIKNRTDPVDTINNNFQINPGDIHEATLDALFNKKNDDEGKNIIDEIINESIKQIDFREPNNSITDMQIINSDYYTMISNQSPEQSLPSPSEKLKNLKITDQTKSGDNFDYTAFRQDFQTNSSFNEIVFDKYMNK